jgi:hypothetical protein
MRAQHTLTHCINTSSLLIYTNTCHRQVYNHLIPNTLPLSLFAKLAQLIELTLSIYINNVYMYIYKQSQHSMPVFNHSVQCHPNHNAITITASHNKHFMP